MKREFAENELNSVAREVLQSIAPLDDGATVLALSGPLGAGKTSLVKALAIELGVIETVVSPTFVIAKWYTPTIGDFTTLVHIDAYRIDSEEELIPLEFSRLLTQSKTLIVIEWPERLPTALSGVPVSLFNLSHNQDTRTIEGPTIYEKER